MEQKAGILAILLGRITWLRTESKNNFKKTSSRGYPSATGGLISLKKGSYKRSLTTGVLKIFVYSFALLERIQCKRFTLNLNTMHTTLRALAQVLQLWLPGSTIILVIDKHYRIYCTRLYTFVTAGNEVYTCKSVYLPREWFSSSVMYRSWLFSILDIKVGFSFWYPKVKT